MQSGGVLLRAPLRSCYAATWQREGSIVQQQAGRTDIYRIRAGLALPGSQRHVLDGAVPPVAADAQSLTFGWVGKGLPLPGTGGSYAVEFLTGNEVRILAYIDLYGRAFVTNEPLTVPPAREPDLSFAKYNEQPVAGEETGCVYARSANGSKVEVAAFRHARGRYDLFDSWFDFGSRGAGLAYDDAMARAYFAFVYRPTRGASPVPERGLRCVRKHISSEKPLAGLRQLTKEVRAAQSDAALCPPALARCLTQWLVDAGLDELADRNVKDDALRLVRTARYADTYYLAAEGEDSGVSPRTVWALEAALNRFLLVGEAFGEQAPTATDVDCARWDAYLIESVATQEPAQGDLADAPEGIPGGEWAVRCAIGSVIERLRLPFRFDVSLRVDVAAGAAAFEMTVPDSSFMPSWFWREGSVSSSAAFPGGTWEQADADARDAQARRYAMHLGLMLASIAFDASPFIKRVDVVARPFTDEADPASASEDREFLPEAVVPVYFQVAFDRPLFERSARFADARAGDPSALYVAAGVRVDVRDADAYALVNELVSATLRRELPEMRVTPLPEPMAATLGADSSAGVRISFDAALRRMGEQLADRIVRVESASDAIHIVRAAQEDAAVAADERTVVACTRLMAALAEGDLDRGDQNAVVGCFLGEDRCLVALGRARTLAQRDPQAAADVLIDAVEEAYALDGFIDGATTVYRSFDSYAARVLYNRAAADAGKQVALVPDSFYLCHLEIARLLEHSFERTDEALRFGRHAIQLAPATAAGYRQLGRAYMLVGDMDSAAETLLEGLAIAVQPTDIAMMYYQLAYVLWKVGRPQDGVACYVKSLSVSPVVALQATAELQELVEETGATIPSRDAVDEALAQAGLPVAPTTFVLDALGEAAAAATDAGLFPVARNLLALRLRYRPDDALVNVLRSLEE